MDDGVIVATVNVNNRPSFLLDCLLSRTFQKFHPLFSNYDAAVGDASSAFISAFISELFAAACTIL